MNDGKVLELKDSRVNNSNPNLFQRISFYRFKLKCAIGRILNLFMPSFVRPCKHGSVVEVKVLPYYTIITVNGLDVYFDRMTGKIDGTGQCMLSPNPDKEG